MLLNSFPLQIVADGSRVIVNAASLNEAVEALLEGGSAIGHQTTADVLTNILGVPVPMARVTIPTSHTGDVVIAQYSGARLPEGATTLPEGAKIEFRRVRWWPNAWGD